MFSYFVREKKLDPRQHKLKEIFIKPSSFGLEAANISS